MIKEEAIEILSDMRAEYNIFSDDEEEATRYLALSWAIQALNERTGRWVYYPEINALSCSICRRYVYHYEPYKFCPNCGARMEVQE